MRERKIHSQPPVSPKSDWDPPVGGDLNLPRRKVHPRAESFTRQIPHAPARIGAGCLQALDAATDRTMGRRTGRRGTRGRACRDRMDPLIRSFQLNVERTGLVQDYRSAFGNPSDHEVPRQKPDRGIDFLGDFVRALFGRPKSPPEFVLGSRRRGKKVQSLPLDGGEDTGVEPGVKRAGLALGIVKIDHVVTDQQNISSPYRRADR